MKNNHFAHLHYLKNVEDDEKIKNAKCSYAQDLQSYDTYHVIAKGLPIT